jgi:peroxiredoxin Q/BCP
MPLIDEGKKAPAFSLADQDGKTHRLADYAGRPVVINFYPKDDTPGCTKESCAFRDNLPMFKKSKAAIFGVSILDEASKKRFADKFDLNFPLLADADHEVADKYGVWQKKSLYGRQFMGIVRTTYLIGPDGKIIRRWDNVKVDGHAEEVLEACASTTNLYSARQLFKRCQSICDDPRPSGGRQTSWKPIASSFQSSTDHSRRP